jgi:transposase
MFLKAKSVRKHGKTHTYWALVKSVRTARGPRHRTVAYLGELHPSQKSGWACLGRSPDDLPQPMPSLWDPDPSQEPVPEVVEVQVRGVRVERSRAFGEVYLAWAVWRMLELDKLLGRLLACRREEVPWSVVALILTLARFCHPGSELHVADSWYRGTALEDLLGVPIHAVGKDRLYRAHDRLLPLKEQIQEHLKERFTTLFDARYDLLLYDVTSTYFEGLAEVNPQAQRGYARDHRPDCKQVCIGLVVTREGLPVACEVFDGNRNDATTVQEIVEAIEAKHGQADRIWVLDRGMVTPENLQYIAQRNGRYIVGTPKSMLKQYEAALLEQDNWNTVQEGLEVKLCPGPNGDEMFVLCRSSARREKEKAMHERFERRIEAGLASLAGRLQKAKTLPDRTQVERQIGRLLGHNSRAAGLFEVHVEQVQRDGRPALEVRWGKRPAWRQWASVSEGCYLLRTNLVGWAPADLWRTYIQLTEAEAAFRTQKSQLALRPIHHQLRDRVQAHILFSFLAYAMWKALEQWMTRSGLGHSPATVIQELAGIKVADVILPTSTGRRIRLRCITEPDEPQRVLLNRLGLQLPARLGEPRWVRHANVVPNSA